MMPCRLRGKATQRPDIEASNVLSFSPLATGPIPSRQAEKLVRGGPIALAQQFGPAMTIRFIPHGDRLFRYASRPARSLRIPVTAGETAVKSVPGAGVG
jgi:hypothetical protein